MCSPGLMCAGVTNSVAPRVGGVWLRCSVRPSRCICVLTVSWSRGRTPMARRVQIKGLRELERKLQRMPRELESEAETATKDEAEDVYEAMRASVPTASGTLGGAIGRRQKGPLSMEVGVLGAKRAWWGALVEFGTSMRPATPFAEPAAREAEARYPKRMAKFLNRRLPPR